MLQTRSNKNETTNEHLVITLRKLNVKDETLHNTKIMVVIQVLTKEDLDCFRPNGTTYRISQARPVKNGVACFYGESIAVTERVKLFRIVVQLTDDDTLAPKPIRKDLAKIEIGQDEINDISKKKCTFSSGSESIELIWEAKFQHDKFQRQQEYQDRSLEDFQDIEVKKQTQTKKDAFGGRKIYSPIIRGEMRKQRSSSRLKKQNPRFDLVSESPHKLTMDTDETLACIKKRIKLMSPSKNKNDNCGLKEFKRDIQYQSNTKPKEIERGQQKKVGTIADKLYRVETSSPVNTSPRKSPTKPRKHSAGFKSSLLTPQHTKKSTFLLPKKRTQKFLDKFNLKSLLYTSVIGIIGGVAASQF